MAASFDPMLLHFMLLYSYALSPRHPNDITSMAQRVYIIHHMEGYHSPYHLHSDSVIDRAVANQRCRASKCREEGTEVYVLPLPRIICSCAIQNEGRRMNLFIKKGEYLYVFGCSYEVNNMQQRRQHCIICNSNVDNSLYTTQVVHKMLADLCNNLAHLNNVGGIYFTLQAVGFNPTTNIHHYQCTTC